MKQPPKYTATFKVACVAILAILCVSLGVAYVKNKPYQQQLGSVSVRPVGIQQVQQVNASEVAHVSGSVKLTLE